MMNKSLSTTDMVALSGGHTIGQARCVSFRNRIYNENNINPSFATSTQANCPSVACNGDDTLSPLDVQSPTIFDNFYFQGLVNQTGLLHSDQQLFNGGSTDSLASTYSTNMAGFFNAFAAAMVNMGNISPLTGSNGEIRINCRTIN
ncbi:peroxidase 4-like [Zingiber officinale]|uniref:peroxidase 4-like n=1 Tax=Zingiber officinale TaxID=94328 RepID=UPI001C4D9FCF|nr:peroxidase 4-like [Zingiber officinale]